MRGREPKPPALSVCYWTEASGTYRGYLTGDETILLLQDLRHREGEILRALETRLARIADDRLHAALKRLQARHRRNIEEYEIQLRLLHPPQEVAGRQ